MLVKKNKDELIIELEKNKFIFDPSQVKEGDINILSDPLKNLNTNKFFNLSGEFEVGNVSFKSYLNKNFLIFVFRYNNVNWIYLKEDLIDDTLNDLYKEWGEIEIAFINGNLKDLNKIKNKLKFKIIIDIDNKNKLKGEKINKELKINFKKIEEVNYII
jgi:hypothetical protein